MTRLMDKLGLGNLPRLRKVVVAVIGGTVLLVGVCMIVLPGPAVVVIPVGLAILATEFVWARRLLHRAKAAISRQKRENASNGEIKTRE